MMISFLKEKDNIIKTRTKARNEVLLKTNFRKFLLCILLVMSILFCCFQFSENLNNNNLEAFKFLFLFFHLFFFTYKVIVDPRYFLKVHNLQTLLRFFRKFKISR